MPRQISGGVGAGAGNRELAVTSAGTAAAVGDGGGRDGDSAGGAAMTSSEGGLAGFAATGGGAHVSNAGSRAAAESPGLSTGSTVGQHPQKQPPQHFLLPSHMSSGDAGPSSLGGPVVRRASARVHGSLPGSFGVTPLAAAGGGADVPSFGGGLTAASAAAVAMMLVPPLAGLDRDDVSAAEHSGPGPDVQQQHQPLQEYASSSVGGAGSTDVFAQPSLNILVAQQAQPQQHQHQTTAHEQQQQQQHHRHGKAAAARAGAWGGLQQATPSELLQSSTTACGPDARPSGGSGGGAAGQEVSSFNFYGSSTPLVSPAPTSYANSHFSRVSQVSVGTSAYTSTGLPQHAHATAAAAAAAPPAAVSTTATTAAAAAATATGTACGTLQVQGSGASATAARSAVGPASAGAAAAAAPGQQPPPSPTGTAPQTGSVQHAYVTRGPFGGSVHGGGAFFGGAAATRGGGGGGGMASSVRNSSSVHGGGAYFIPTAGSNVLTTSGLFYAGSSMPGNLYTATGAVGGPGGGSSAGPNYVTHAVRTSVHHCRAPSIGGASTSSAAHTVAPSLHQDGGVSLLRLPGASTLGRPTAVTGGGRGAALRAGIITCNPALLEDGASLYAGGGGSGRAGAGGAEGDSGGGGGAGGGVLGRSDVAGSLSSATTKSHRFQPTRTAGPAMRAFHLAWAALFLTFVSAFAPAALSPVIAPDLHLSKPVLAVAGAMSLLSSFITRVLMGAWVRRYGPRYCQALTLLLTAPALACTALVRNAAGFVAARAAIGTGLASFVSSNFWVVLMFDSSVLGAAAATCTSWGNAGSGVSLILMPLLYEAMLKVYSGKSTAAWSAVFYFPAGAHLVLGVLTLVFGQDTALGDFLDFDSAGEDLPGGAMLAAAGGGSYHTPTRPADSKLAPADVPVAPSTPAAKTEEGRKQQQKLPPPQSPQLLLPIRQFTGPQHQHEAQAFQSTAATGLVHSVAGPSAAAGPQLEQFTAAQAAISGAGTAATGAGVATAMAAHATKHEGSNRGGAGRGTGAQPVPGGDHGPGRGSQAGDDLSMHDLPQRLPSASLRGWRAASSARQISLRRLDVSGGGGAGENLSQLSRGAPRAQQRELLPPTAASAGVTGVGVALDDDGDDDEMLDGNEPIFLLARMGTERIEEHSETLASAGSSSARAAGTACKGAGTDPHATTAGPVAEGLEEPALGAADAMHVPEPTLEIELLPADDAAAGEEQVAAAELDQQAARAAAQPTTAGFDTAAPASVVHQDKTGGRLVPPYLEVPPSPTAALAAVSAGGRIVSPFRSAGMPMEDGELDCSVSPVPPAAPFRTAVTIPVQQRSGAAAAQYATGPSPASSSAAAGFRVAIGGLGGDLAVGSTPGSIRNPGSLPAVSPATSAAAVTAEGVPPASSVAGASSAHTAYLNVVRGRLSQGGAIKAAAAAAAAATGNAGGRGQLQQQGMPAGAAAAGPDTASAVTHLAAGGEDPSHHPRWSNNNAPAGSPAGGGQQPVASNLPAAVGVGGGAGSAAARDGGAASLLPAPRPPKHHHALGLGMHEALQLYSMACRNYRCLLLALNYGYNFGAQLALYNILSVYLCERFGMSFIGAGALAAMPGLLNVFSRVSGSLLSGLVCRHFGMRGRLWLLWATQTAGGLCCVGLGLCGGGQSGLGATGVLLLLFGLFTQIAAGTTSTIAPYMSFRAFAAVLGVTSAGGQLGGVVLLLAFFVTTSLSYQEGILWMGVAIILVSLSIMAIRFPMWGGMLVGPDTRYGGVQEEQYYLSEWTPEEQASGVALPALIFAMHARSERSGWDYCIEKRSLARV
ncbi:hypothetical protein HYH02_005949 [Chlamydomonas schloesseri]|uniref:Major facilitator superfamily (MFS) profile domain-containing protein n=1 Tax=Chlamydomonas schloesseri TaxID=2026947 RepID=A0A835WKE3_9CHLO|nr:hypothetical protein HYH02_005949 [Chlamydomonas schloesseri]|eukprot:KAG2449202.1 hypothetical protein HYH02_005949 [Chlamydomonas schloesseri]